MTVAVISDPMNAPIRRVASPEIRRSVNLIKFSSCVLGTSKGRGDSEFSLWPHVVAPLFNGFDLEIE